jgi:molecular chaperone GrpE
MDSLERALEAAPAGENPFFEGMQKIRDQFCAALTSLGVVEIEAKGKQFDPNLHNAVMHEECDMEPDALRMSCKKDIKSGIM